MSKPVLDCDNNIVVVGDTLIDAMGRKKKIENIEGKAYLVHREKGVIREKHDFETINMSEYKRAERINGNV